MVPHTTTAANAASRTWRDSGHWSPAEPLDWIVHGAIWVAQEIKAWAAGAQKDETAIWYYGLDPS